MPACAIMAVPGAAMVSNVCMACMRRKSACTEDKIELYAFPVLLRSIASSAEERLVFSSTLG